MLFELSAGSRFSLRQGIDVRSIIVPFPKQGILVPTQLDTQLIFESIVDEHIKCLDLHRNMGSPE